MNRLLLFVALISFSCQSIFSMPRVSKRHVKPVRASKQARDLLRMGRILAKPVQQPSYKPRGLGSPGFLADLLERCWAQDYWQKIVDRKLNYTFWKDC
jgi:hypothetical protein